MNMRNKQNQPTAIILADRTLSGNLKTVFGETEMASLVVAGYTILDYLLMELRDLGFDQCIVLAKQSAKKLQARFSKSQRWGMTITIMDFALSKDQVLREYKSLSEPNGLLVFEMNRLRGHCVKRFLELANKSDYSLFEGVVSGQAMGITFLKQTNADFVINAKSIELEGLVFNDIKNCRDFHRANFELIAGNYDGLDPSVRRNSELGLRQHWASKVHKNTKLHSKENMIERRCQIGSNARLESVILNHDVLIEHDAKIRNSIVMPNSVISNQMPIKNAIVNDGQVFQIH